jgi:hypothetical protein
MVLHNSFHKPKLNITYLQSIKKPCATNYCRSNAIENLPDRTHTFQLFHSPGQARPQESPNSYLRIIEHGLYIIFDLANQSFALCLFHFDVFGSSYTLIYLLLGTTLFHMHKFFPCDFAALPHNFNGCFLNSEKHLSRLHSNDRRRYL